MCVCVCVCMCTKKVGGRRRPQASMAEEWQIAAYCEHSDEREV